MLRKCHLKPELSQTSESEGYTLQLYTAGKKCGLTTTWTCWDTCEQLQQSGGTPHTLHPSLISALINGIKPLDTKGLLDHTTLWSDHHSAVALTLPDSCRVVYTGGESRSTAWRRRTWRGLTGDVRQQSNTRTWRVLSLSDVFTNNPLTFI